MPTFIYLKSPSIVLLADDDLFNQNTEKLNKMLGGAMEVRMRGQRALIPIKEDCNITYIKEVTKEEAEEFRRRREQEIAADKDAGRIQRPQMMIPGLKKGMA